MADRLLDIREQVARKAYRCLCCTATIPAGEKYVLTITRVSIARRRVLEVAHYHTGCTNMRVANGVEGSKNG